MDETEYLLNIFKPYVKFEKVEDDDFLTTYSGYIDKGLSIDIVITHHIVPNIGIMIEGGYIDIFYYKQLKDTRMVIRLRQENNKHLSISFDADAIKEILIETEEEFHKRIME